MTISTTAEKTQRVQFWGRYRNLPVDPAVAHVRTVFTQGQCHSFARALHRLTGWPLYVLGRPDPDKQRTSASELGDHVVCRHPDGRFVDIEGAWSPGEKWKGCSVEMPRSERTVQRLCWDKQDVWAAMPFARKILEEVLK